MEKTRLSNHYKINVVSNSSLCYDQCSREQDCLATTYQTSCLSDCNCYLYKNDYSINNDNNGNWESTFKTYDDLMNVPIERDCFVSEFLEWSSCINGAQQRERKITLQPTDGGKQCPSLIQARKCDFLIFM